MQKLGWKLLLGTLLYLNIGLAIAGELLPRSSFLGLIPESTGAGEAVKVSSLHPAGTAKNLGLLVGDVIKEVNQQSTKDFSVLITQLRGIRAGDQISVLVQRGDETKLLSTTAIDRPRESGEGFKVSYDALNWQQEKIRTITYTPDKPRKDGAAVFFIQGYTCGSIDYGMLPDISLNQLLGSYAQAGFSVFKMEKPGVGDSTGSLRCENYDFTLENNAFKAGLSHFKQQDGVNADNVFVFGHSLGVLHAALLAEKGLVKGAIGYGGVVKSWYDYLLDIYSKQSVMYWGVTESQAKANAKLVKPFLKQWLKTSDSWASVIENETNQPALSADILPINGEQVFQRHYSFFRNLNQFDFAQLWQSTQAHTLMLHGHYDIQAIEDKWAKQIATLTNEHTKYSGQALFFDNTDHSLMRYKNKTELMQATRREGNVRGEFNSAIAEQSLTWMQNILTKN